MRALDYVATLEEENIQNENNYKEGDEGAAINVLFSSMIIGELVKWKLSAREFKHHMF